jgi:hypothetical protein
MSNKPLDFSKPVQTRDGRAVRILCTNAKNRSNPVIGLIDAGDRESLVEWRSDGRYFGNTESECDLVNVPTKRTVWVTVDTRPGDGQIGYVFASKESAEDFTRGLAHALLVGPVEIEL